MNPNKIGENENINERNKDKKTFFKKLKKMAKKTRHWLKNFFPRRIRPIKKENNKGPKF